MGNRRTYITLAEGIRNQAVSADTKATYAEVVAESLAGRPGFDAERFAAHALGTHGDEKWAYNRATQTGGFIPAPRVDALAARRSYVNLAEAIRALDVSMDVKQNVVAVAVEELRGEEAPAFDANRFRAHAFGTYGDAKWAYNRANGGPVLSDADTIVL